MTPYEPTETSLSVLSDRASRRIRAAELRVAAAFLANPAARDLVVSWSDGVWEFTEVPALAEIVDAASAVLHSREAVSPMRVEQVLFARGVWTETMAGLLSQLVLLAPSTPNAEQLREDLGLLQAATALRQAAADVQLFLARIRAWDGNVDAAHELLPGLLALDL